MNREKTIQTVFEDEDIDIPVLGKTFSKSAPSSPQQGAPCTSHETREETIDEMIARRVRENREKEKRKSEEREAKRLEERRIENERLEARMAATKAFLEKSRNTLVKSE